MLIENKADMDSAIVPDISFCDLEFFERLSAGSFGSVYRARWKSCNKIVAVKKVLVLEKEAKLLSYIRHKNIIQFFGVVTESPNFCIVLEFASKGSLYSFLHKTNESSDESDDDLPPLRFDLVIRWALEIASGVNYLHNEAPIKILHRDLKSGNIVIDSENTCKLCDFGASRVLQHTTKVTTVGTIPWMSPELIQNLPAGETVDTWSYAVVFWEMLTREIPFNGVESFRIAWIVVEQNERLCIPLECPDEIREFLHRCWSKEPKSRPCFPEIISLLKKFQNDTKTSKDINTFMTQRRVWLSEIKSHLNQLETKESLLSQKEQQLKQWEERLNEREENLSIDKNNFCKDQDSFEFDRWGVDDVADWFSKMQTDFGRAKQSFEKKKDQLLSHSFFNQLRENQIDGCRLRLLTDNDLRHFGLKNSLFRHMLLDQIDRLNGSGSDQSFEAFFRGFDTDRIRKTPERTSIRLTFLAGLYLREGSNRSDHKWKFFFDIDDIAEFDLGRQLINYVDVKFRGQHFILSHSPYIAPDWLIGFIDGEKIDFSINLNQSLILSPIQIELQYELNFLNRSFLMEKQVELVLLDQKRRKSFPDKDWSKFGFEETNRNGNNSINRDSTLTHLFFEKNPARKFGKFTSAEKLMSDRRISDCGLESSFRSSSKNNNFNMASPLVGRTTSEDANSILANRLKKFDIGRFD